LVGADAVGPDSFINKVGTAGLAILAAAEGVPVYVLAGREKLLNEADFASLDLRAGNDAEVWETRPAGLVLRNPYFESTPLSCISALVTDGGVRYMSI
jgi:ribose 1,5-bisphosphate isomerase